MSRMSWGENDDGELIIVNISIKYNEYYIDGYFGRGK